MAQLAAMDFRSTPLSAAARALGLLTLIAVSISLALQFVASSLSIPEDTPLQIAWALARYFTILTNGLVFGTFLWVGFARRPPGPVWMAGLTVWIAMTGAVFYLLLNHDQPPLSEWADIGLHAITPILVLVWWVGFAPKAGLKPGMAFLWLLWPALYIVYVLGRGQIDGRYPYFFLDPAQVGWDGVVIWSGLVGLGFLLAGLLLVLVGRMFGR